MSGNTFGTLFTVTSFGESHGPAIGCVIDGCPPLLEISQEEIQAELNRRRPGTSRHVTQRQEPDTVEILSGVFEGKTTGTPIALLIRNQDQRSKDYGNIAQQFRPGHADFTYWHKYGIRDYRGGGRSSARETAVRVAAGAIAKKWLKQQFNTEIVGFMTQLGNYEIPIQTTDFQHINNNPFFAPINISDVSNVSNEKNGKEIFDDLESYMDQLRKEGDSCGAKIEIHAKNVPIGLGEPVFDRLDADLAFALMSINAVKGVEIGDGFACVTQKGSEHGDGIRQNNDFQSNHAGGILGGISTGQTIISRIAIKPTSSIRLERPSIDIHGNEVTVQTFGRHDPCVGIRATPIAEAMVALTLIDHALRFRGQTGVQFRDELHESE